MLFLKERHKFIARLATSVVILITIEYFYWWFVRFFPQPAAIAAKHEKLYQTFDSHTNGKSRVRLNSILRLMKVQKSCFARAIKITLLLSQVSECLPCFALGFFEFIFQQKESDMGVMEISSQNNYIFQ